jgi:sporulation protein YlmC with PRC-barrel domain
MGSDMENHGGIIGHEAAGTTAPHVIAADALTGHKVVAEDGEMLGHVVHIMLDVSSGRIVYAVMAFGGLLGLGDKLFAIPWHALAYDVEDKWFVMNIDKQRLRDAPGFDKNNWPSMADPKWAQEVHSYYGPVAVSRRPFI